MMKDFQLWHREKTQIDSDKIRPFFHEREVWFCSLGENVGFEQNGKGESFLRPVVILKKFNNEVLWALPLTSKLKGGKHYSKVSFKSGEYSTAILSQIRLIDAKRLQYKVGNIAASQLVEIKEKIKQFLA